jgi:hypothetical protein
MQYPSMVVRLSMLDGRHETEGERETCIVLVLSVLSARVVVDPLVGAMGHAMLNHHSS